jgi:hypothetical protein
VKRRIGPILHHRRGTPAEWNFAVGLWLERSDGEPLPALTFAHAANAVVTGPVTTSGTFGGAEWVYWKVSVPRQPQEFPTDYRIDGLDDGPVAIDGVVVPGQNKSPRIAFFSCNGVQDSADWTTTPAMEELWTRMLERHRAGIQPDRSGGAYHLLLGGGDQIYCDSVWESVPALEKRKSWKDRRKIQVGPALHRALERHYASLYSRWGMSAFAEMHARVPGIYTWDDHDIFDGWGSYGDDLQGCDVFKAIYAQACRAFTLFQIGGDKADSLCVDPAADHFLQAAHPSDELDVLLLDLRSGRGERQVMSADQWSALNAYLGQRAAQKPAAAHLLVVSSIPLVYLNFGSAESFLDWVPWQQELEDDLRDQWESRDHQEERARLIMTLLNHSKETSSRVTVLSGDVHVGSRGRIVSRRPAQLLPGESETIVHQLTSSGIVYPPPGAFALAGMRTVAKEGPATLLTISQVETEVVRVCPKHFLLGERNWLSIEPDAAHPHEGEKLWTRWITNDGDVDPPILIHAR